MFYHATTVILCLSAIAAEACPGGGVDCLHGARRVERAEPPGSKSLAKCKEYGESVFQVTELPVALLRRPNKTIDTCARPPLTLIIGGTPAKEKEFPHMAAIGYDNKDKVRVYGICGGSLISERYVLTAGHCLFTLNFGEPKSVRLGDLNLKRDDDAEPVDYDVVQIIEHPDYDPPSQYHDIGLLKLHADVFFTAYIRPVCLNTLRTYDRNQNVTAVGWGSTKFRRRGSDVLLKVTLENFEHGECGQHYKAHASKLVNGLDDELQLCAGTRTEVKRDTCPGDSGGPLTIYNTDVYCMYDLVGVTSFGKPCGLTTSPGVYTRVSHYVPWLESVIWP